MAREKEDDLVVEGLTAEEQAALAEGAADDAAEFEAAKVEGTVEETGDTKAAAAEAAEVAAGKTEDDAAAGKVVEEKPVVEGADAAAAAAAAKPEGEAAAVVAEKTIEDLPAPARRHAVPDWQPPENADARLKEIATAREAIATSADNAEITYKEMVLELHKLDTEERTLVRAIERAEEAGQFAQADWFKNTVPDFLAANAHYETNETLRAMLNTEVVRRQTAILKDGGDQFDPNVLIEADKAIKAALTGIGVAAPAGGKVEEKPAGKVEEKPAAAAAAATALTVKPKPALPPTLAQVPAADPTGTDSKYAVLDRMATADPIAFEDAMARLPDADRDAYLARH